MLRMHQGNKWLMPMEKSPKIGFGALTARRSNLTGTDSWRIGQDQHQLEKASRPAFEARICTITANENLRVARGFCRE
eukprot:925120-Amphidinium_carterae.2